MTCDPSFTYDERDRIDALLDRREPPPTPTEALEIIEEELQKFYSDHPEWREAVRALERMIEREERLRGACEVGRSRIFNYQAGMDDPSVRKPGATRQLNDNALFIMNAALKGGD